MAKIIAYEEVGEENTYDLEVAHKDHQFYLANGLLTSNSHSTGYCLTSYQCAWLLHYHPSEWAAAFLEWQPEARKEKAIASVKALGYKIEDLNINTSGLSWEISEDGETLIQPLTSVKGLGDKAIEQIFIGRPFDTVEEFLFHPDLTYSKLNKRAVDILCRSGALNCLIDDRFTGRRHFWSAVAVDRPRTIKKLSENITLYAPEGDFSREELISYAIDLTGIFPFRLVLEEDTRLSLEEKGIPPISRYDYELGGVVWFVVRQVLEKKTRRGKDYYLLDVIDNENERATIRCWGVNLRKDRVFTNRVYIAKLEHNSWGFSTRNLSRTFRLLS